MAPRKTPKGNEHTAPRQTRIITCANHKGGTGETTTAVNISDCDERHGLLLAVGRSQDEVQCDIIRSPSPLLEHYQFIQCIDHFDLRQSPIN